MKSRLFFMAVALVALVITGCGKDNEPSANSLNGKVVGEWHYASEEYDADVYVAFAAEGTFDEYQRLGEGRYRHYSGTWTMNKDVLNGVYDDGVEWGSSYKVVFGDDTMTLTSTNGSAEAIIYVKDIIPEEVKQNAIAPFALRSDGVERWF